MTLRKMLETMGSLRGRFGTNEQARWILLAQILAEICESQGIDLDNAIEAAWTPEEEKT